MSVEEILLLLQLLLDSLTRFAGILFVPVVFFDFFGYGKPQLVASLVNVFDKFVKRLSVVALASST